MIAKKNKEKRKRGEDGGISILLFVKKELRLYLCFFFISIFFYVIIEFLV